MKKNLLILLVLAGTALQSCAQEPLMQESPRQAPEPVPAIMAGDTVPECYRSAGTGLNVVPRLLNYGRDVNMAAGVREIDVVIIHSVYNPLVTDSFSVEAVLSLFKRYDVSAHYLIDRKGTIYNLVKENDISWHGGKGSLPDGGMKVNTRSVGIELINSLFTAPDTAQYLALAALVTDLYERHEIKYLLGHNHTAPGRKTDPWNFDWIYFDCLLEKESAAVRQ